MPNAYLIDANVFVQGKNFHYQFDFCGGFWEWVSVAHNAKLVYSVNKVKKELLDADPTDECRIWAQKMPASFFLDDDTDAGVMANYGKVNAWAAASTHYLPAAKAKFADVSKADAFLIAAAMHHGFHIVTHEKSNAEKKKEIPIPNAADQMGLKTLTIYELLKKHSLSTFAFKP